MEEGFKSHLVYLILEGEVALSYSHSPYNTEITAGKVKDTGERLSQERKLLPKSVNSFLLCVWKEGEWIGDEYMFLKMPYHYTATAKNFVKILRLTQSDFKQRLPRDYVSLLENSAESKHYWLLSRMKGIMKSADKIYKQVYQDQPLS